MNPAMDGGRMSSMGGGDAAGRMSYMESARSSIDCTARFGAPAAGSPQQAVPNFGNSPALSDTGPRFGSLAAVREGGRTGPQLLDVLDTTLGTTDVADVQTPPPASSAGRAPSQYELATPVIMQEITQNLRKTMVGLSNEVKARENEDWRLEQGFTQLDSRRELMCVQLHTRYEQTKNELEAVGKQVSALEGRSDGFRDQTSQAEAKFQEFGLLIRGNGDDAHRVESLVSTLQSETTNLKILIERLQEKQASIESRAGAIEARSQAAIAQMEAAPREPTGKSPSQAALEDCMEKQVLLEHRCGRLEDSDGQRKVEVDGLRQSVVECKTFDDKSSGLHIQFERRFGEIESKSVAHTVKLDSMQDSLSHLQALLQVSEEAQRGRLQEFEVQRTGQKTQIETLQENLNQLQSRLQQQRLAEEAQMEQLDSQSSGHGMRIESLQESVGQMQAWLQQQSMIEEKRAQIERYNAAHRAETDSLRNSVKTLEETLQTQTPVDERSAALDAREAGHREELDSMLKMLDSHKMRLDSHTSTNDMKLEAVTSSIQLVNGAVQEVRASSEEGWSAMGKSMERFTEALAEVQMGSDEAMNGVTANAKSMERLNEVLVEVQMGSDEARSGVTANAKSVQRVSDSLEEVRTSSEEVRIGTTKQVDEKCTMLESKFQDFNALFEAYESKFQDFNGLLVGQDERFKMEIGVLRQGKQELQVEVEQGKQELQVEMAVLRQSKQELQSRLDGLHAKTEIAQTQLQDQLQNSTREVATLDSALSTRLSSQLSQLEFKGVDQQQETSSLRGLVESLQGRMETVQGAQAQLGDSLRRDFEAVISGKLQIIGEKSKLETEAMEAEAKLENMKSKLEAETSSQELKRFVEAETSTAQSGVKRLEMELQEDRRRRSEEVRLLETKDAEQSIVLSEFRSRLDIQDDTARSQFENSGMMAPPLSPGVECTPQATEEQNAKLASMRAKMQAATEALQLQHDVVRSQLQEHVIKSQEDLLALEARLRAAHAAQASTMEATTMVRENPAQSEDSSMWEELMLTKLGEAQKQFQEVMDDERRLSAEKIRSLGRTVSEECGTQASTQARIVVQSMLSQELDSWRRELSAVSCPPTPTPELRTKTPRAAGMDDDELDPPGLAEAVRRLDDKLAMQRREASALDGLLRSELEVQRRQQSLTSSTLQTLQNRVSTVEERTEAMRTQLEENLREGSVVELEDRSTPVTQSARFSPALTDVTPGASIKVPMQGQPAIESTAQGQSATGDDIHRRIKALSAKMAACQGAGADGGSAMVSNPSAGTIDTLSTSRGISRLDEQSGQVLNALNGPQMRDLMTQQQQQQQGGHATFQYRQPSMERGALQASPIAVGPAGNLHTSRGLYAMRALSPGMRTATPHRATSPGAQRYGSTRAPTGSASLPPHSPVSSMAAPSFTQAPGQMSPRDSFREPQLTGSCQTPGRTNLAGLSEHRIQRITTTPVQNTVQPMSGLGPASTVTRRSSAAPLTPNSIPERIPQLPTQYLN